MEQIIINRDTLILKVKTYLAVKILFCFMSLVMFLGPLIGLILWVSDGNRFHIKFLFGMAFSYAVAYYVLRYTLWNTWGREILEFQENQIVHTLDFKFWKRREVYENTEIEEFGFTPFGYEEDKKGRLYIQLKGQSIITSITIPNSDLKKLINRLENSASFRY